LAFLRLADLPNFALDRLSRYEATLWRQAGRILYALADVVASEHLAVAVNGTLFSSKSSWWRAICPAT
jgi:hypothetical protein